MTRGACQHAAGRFAAGLLLLVGLLLTAPPAPAQVTWQVDNISPLTSSFDGSDPNSASGGRVNQLGSHPTNAAIHFAASEWGGLFQTADGGRNWVAVQGHRPQATWDVEFNPANPATLIATSWFDGRSASLSGISVSRDGGTTWSVPATARPAAAACTRAIDVGEPAAFGIAFDPANANRVFVGTNCGLAISTDNGATWIFRDPTPNVAGSTRVVDVVVHHSGIVDICGDQGHQRSTDGGATFVDGALTEPAGNCSIAASPDEANTLFLSVGTQILESRDGGASWPTTFANPGPQGRIPFVRVNDRAGAAFDLWFGDTRLFRAGCTTPANPASTAQRCPASNTWAAAQTGAHWDVGDLAFRAATAVDACPTLFSNDGGIYFNTRTGADCHDPRWEQPTTTVTALWLWDMAGNARAAAGEEGVYMGQQDSGAFGTRQAPAAAPSWSAPGCCDVFDVEAEAGRVIYSLCCFGGGGRATRLFRDDDSMDGGPEIPAAGYPAGNLVSFQDSGSIANYAANSYAMVTSGGIFFTTNIGGAAIAWQALGTGAPANMCGVKSARRANGTPVFFVRAGFGACSIIGGRSGQVWRHEGATTTGAWTRVDRGGQSNFGVFAADPANPDHIVANDMSGAAPAMVRTTNGGATWAALPALDAALTGGGAFIGRVQAGATGAGYSQASLVAINPANPAMMLAGGQDSGLFLTVNSGVNWTILSDPRTSNALRPHISRPLFAHFESSGVERWNAYVGARGRGVWRVGVDVENRWAGAVWEHTGVACTGQSCPGWRRLDNNVATVALAAAAGNLYQLHHDGRIWRSTGAACNGDDCPGWTLLDNNPATVAIAAGGGSLYQLHNDGRIWRSTGAACSGQSCPGWVMLDNNPATVGIAAGGGSLYQLHRDGRIWRSTGAACAGQSCPGWVMLDNNAATIAIAASSTGLFQQHRDGRIWRSTGAACVGQSCPGWTMLDNNAATADIVSIGAGLVQRHRGGDIFRSTGVACSGQSCPGWVRLDNNAATVTAAGSVYQEHRNGLIWKSTGVACSGTSCPGWTMLDNNPRTRDAVPADGDPNRLYQLHAPKLFQRHNDGAIYQSRGGTCVGPSCPSWQRLDANPQTRAIAAGGGRLYQLHVDGKIWRSNGRPCADTSCPGWEMLDANPRTRKIVAAGGQLYQLHNDGKVWRFTGSPCVGQSCPSWVMLDNNAATDDILASGGQLFQKHSNGRIWRSTGIACSGQVCPGWVMLDNNPRTVAIAGDAGRLYQLHNDGRIWEHNGVACTNQSCPGWRMLDNNSRTTAIAAGGHELYQLHNDGRIWEFTGVACAAQSCPGWRMLDNNPQTRGLTAAGGQLYQRHADGAIWRGLGTGCSGASCPGWEKLDANPRTVEIVAARR